MATRSRSDRGASCRRWNDHSQGFSRPSRGPLGSRHGRHCQSRTWRFAHHVPHTGHSTGRHRNRAGAALGGRASGISAARNVRLDGVCPSRALCPKSPEVAFAETGTLPWLTRKHGPFEVAITIRAKRLPTGVLPARLADHALTMLSRVFPGVIEPCEDTLSAALMNAGPIIHPPLIIMNAAPLEHFPRWDIHKEGTQPVVRRVTDALDAERIAIRQALDYRAPHFPLANHYAREGEEWMYGRGSHEKLTDSGDWREKIVLTHHRYMREDVALGLSFLASAGELAGVPTPLTAAFLTIGSAICGEDFRRTGRTLAGLGLGHLHRAELKHLLYEGVS